MKKFLILFAAAFTTTLLAQTPNWTGVKETNINVGSAVSVDIFTNRDGNHIIVQESNSLKYYKMNLNGVAGSPVTIENSAIVSPSISGDANNIYIVYGIGNQVRVKRSTDGGVNWNLWTNFSLATTASYMESVFSNENLHVTYLESGSVKYRYRHQLGTIWNGPYVVSTGENGTLPRITASYGGSGKDSVYFVWQKAGTFQFNHRRYEVTTNSWSSVLFGHIVTDPYVNITSVWLSGFRITSSTIIMYFTYAGTDLQGNYRSYFNWVWKDKNSNTYQGAGYPYLAMGGPVYSTTTFDGNSHTAYYYFQLAGGEGGGQSEVSTIRRSKQPSGYPDDIIYDYGINPPIPDPMHINLSSAGNEVHAIWKDNLGSNNGNNLRYKWDDQNPIAPQNPQLSANPGNNKIRISWTRNNEADISFYEVWRKVAELGGVWQNIGTTTNNYFVDNEYLYAPAAGDFTITYKVRAKDIGNKYSDFSVGVTTRGEYIGKDVTEVNMKEFRLNDNYPNPFNPSTKISWQSPVSGWQTLKVYDVLGNEVATLVDEFREAGNYEVEFQSSVGNRQLASGIYFYRIAIHSDKLTAGSFTEVKKMILAK